MSEIEFDFSTLSDGDPLPALFRVGILREVGGSFSIESEDAASLYYFAQDGKAVFNYTEQFVGGGLNRRGYVSFPGTLDSSDADIHVQFANPLENFSEDLDEVHMVLGLGYRGKAGGVSWIGGLLETHWVASAWSPKWKLSVVRADGNNFTEIEYLEEDVPFQDLNELSLTVEGTEIECCYNGIKTILAESAFRGESQIVLMARAFVDDGVSPEQLPLIQNVSGRGLPSGQFSPFREIPGNYVPFPFDEAHCFRVPIRELSQSGNIVQRTPNLWEVVKATEVDRPEDGIKFAASVGAFFYAPRQTLPDAEVQTCKFMWYG